jgi:hypothetical protein
MMNELLFHGVKSAYFIRNETEIVTQTLNFSHIEMDVMGHFQTFILLLWWSPENC